MTKINSLLNERLRRKPSSSKMTSLARASSDGKLSSFSGVFQVGELSQEEQHLLEELLVKFSDDESDIRKDLKTLSTITSEVKAISNQAALLHGERIHKAQSILTRYKDGAFSEWLNTAYGNRQTPYNFLQYFRFHETVPKDLRHQLEKMPRQAVYSLASRDGDDSVKLDVVRKYNGQSKNQILLEIRALFPLSSQDRRQHSPADLAICGLEKISAQLSRTNMKLGKRQKKRIEDLLEDLFAIVESK